MSKLAYFPLLPLAVAVTTAGLPFVPPVQPAMTLAPAAIIEGGTVSTLPKSVKTRNGKVVVLRPRADRPAQPAKRPAAPASRVRGRGADVVREQAVASGGGSPADVVELRHAEQGLRVMILGPDGLTRTRYVPE